MSFMSSPKRAAKAIARNVKTAAKAGRRPVPARPAAKPKVAVLDGASADAKRLAAVLERGIVDGKLDMVSSEALQKLFAAVCRVYTARVEAGEPIMPVPKNSISATDLIVTGSGLLKTARSRRFTP